MTTRQSRVPNQLDPAAATVLWELRAGPNTVESLSTALRITPNAVRNQLQKLERLGLIRREGKQATASKPSVVYAITLEGQVQFSKLYLPVLTQFLTVAEERCRGNKLAEMMSETGTALARRFEKPEGTLRKRVENAAILLQSFGGMAEATRSREGYVMRSAGCPLAAITAHQPNACHVLESFLEEYLSARVTICCETGDHPRCCFEVRAA